MTVAPVAGLCRNRQCAWTEIALLLFQVLIQYLANTVRERTHAMRAEAQGTAAPDTGQLSHHLPQALPGRDWRGKAENVRDEPTNGLRHRRRLGSSLGRVDKHLEGLG